MATRAWKKVADMEMVTNRYPRVYQCCRQQMVALDADDGILDHYTPCYLCFCKCQYYYTFWECWQCKSLFLWSLWSSALCISVLTLTGMQTLGVTAHMTPSPLAVQFYPKMHANQAGRSYHRLFCLGWNPSHGEDLPPLQVRVKGAQLPACQRRPPCEWWKLSNAQLEDNVEMRMRMQIWPFWVLCQSLVLMLRQCVIVMLPSGIRLPWTS